MLVCLSDKKESSVYLHTKGGRCDDMPMAKVPYLPSRLLSAWSVWIFHSFIPNKVFNPFIDPACKISGLKNARTHLKQCIFRSYSTSTVSAMRFDENPSP